MSNSYYVATGEPGTGAFAASAPMRSEFQDIENGFDLMPALTAGTAVVVNGAGTALGNTVGRLALAGNFSTVGAFNLAVIVGASVSLTAPLADGTLATLAGTETFSNKTFGANNNMGTPIALVGTNITGTAAGLTAGSVSTIPNLTGPITSVGTVTSIASQTGTGSKFVVDTSPALITPSLGVATATSVNGLTITSSTGTLTIAALKVATVSNTLTFTGTDGSSVAFGTGGTVLYANQAITLSGDVSGSGTTAITTTLATVNGNVGTFGSATQSVQFTVNGKGLITAAANVTVTPAVGSITGLGTGVATALAVNVGSAGAFVTFNGAGGTPSSMVGTNITGTASGLTAGNIVSGATLPAVTLGGTVSGGGNQINNVIIGTATPLAGTFTTLVATTINGNTFTTGTGVLTIAAAKTLTVSNTLTLAGTDSTVMTFPSTSATIARTDAANTFTGVQTFSTPIASASMAAMTATVGGRVPTPPNNTTTFLRGDGTFAAPPSAGVAVIRVQAFTTTGTYTPNANMLYCQIELVGGGGGGGGSSGGVSGSAAAGGGGAGSYARLVASLATIGASKTVTIGAAGTAGAAATGTGGNGGDTSVGTLCIGKGGSGGVGSASGGSVGSGGAGGVAGTGDFTPVGMPGGAGEIGAVSFSVKSGVGGSSLLGGGGAEVVLAGAANTAGNAGGNYGSGGSGGTAFNIAANAAGGAGSAGYVIVTEYCSA